MPRTIEATEAINKAVRTTSRIAAPSRATGSDSPNTLDTESRTVRAVIASDTPVQMYDWQLDEEFDEVLIPSGMVQPKRMRLRVDHSSYRSLDVIGRVFDFAIGKRTVEATLRFSKASDVEPIFTRVSEGDLDSVSIGASYNLKNTIRLEPGQSKEIDGANYTAKKIPMRIVRIWEPSETSIVDEGADSRAVIRKKDGTGKRSEINSNQLATRESSQRRQGKTTSGPQGTNMPTKRTRPVDQASKTQPSDDVATTRSAQEPSERRTRSTDEARTAKRSKLKETLDDLQRGVERLQPQVDTGTDTANAVATERKRISKINDMAGGENPMPAELVQRAINEGWSVAKAGQRFFEHVQRSSQKPVRQTGDGVERGPAVHSAGGVSIEALQAAVLMRAGVNLQNPAFASEAAQIVFARSNCEWLYRFNRDLLAGGKSEDEKVIDIGRKFRHDHPARTCERILAYRGKTVPHDTEVMVERSFASPYMPRVFGALVNAGIIQGYAEYADSTIGWVGTADWADFRMNQPIGIDASRGLRKHTRGTAAKDVDFTEYGDPYALARYTGKFTLDDMDIIDDQIGANQMLPAEMGKMAARLRPDLIYAILLTNGNMADGNPLFHSSRANLVTSAPVSVDGLTLAEAAMALQKVTSKTGSARALNMMAGHVIVPRSQRANGKKATASTKVVSGSATQIGDLNPHEGEYMLHSDARIDIGVEDPRNETAVTGTTDFWFLAESTGQQTLQVGYRRGTGRAPQIRTRAISDIGTWGIGWDCALDIGVGVITGRGLVRAKITA